MSINTPAKRSSALDHEEVWASGMPLPDGAVGQGDRQHLIWTYSGSGVSDIVFRVTLSPLGTRAGSRHEHL